MTDPNYYPSLSPCPHCGHSAFTPAELAVAPLMARGMPWVAIGRRLRRDPDVVHATGRRLMRKTGCQDRAEFERKYAHTTETLKGQSL